MNAAWGLFLLSGFCPLFLAWRANQRTTLRSAVAWAGCAWAAWAVSAWVVSAADLLRYLALCLGACAGVAVLGARRPGVAAWNFVVAGLLAVLLRPLAEGLGELKLSAVHVVCLGAALAVPLLNYLPTRLLPAVLAFAVAGSVELAGLSGLTVAEWLHEVGRWSLAAGPWLALAAWAGRPAPGTGVDEAWRGFRDRFGLVWGQRLREQFNRAAENLGLPVHLDWSGLRTRPEAAPPPEQALALLRAALKRFGPEEPAVG
jgi:hypothetical protein